MTEAIVESTTTDSKRNNSKMNRDTVFIGQKPVMSYVTAVMMHFAGDMNKLTIKARGNAISRAVDVVEVCRRRFFSDTLTIKDITIGTEVLGESGDTRNVSTIEIKLTK
jgi:DNA-binding protein